MILYYIIWSIMKLVVSSASESEYQSKKKSLSKVLDIIHKNLNTIIVT